jgi:3-methylcrotonyl-CoA carboxylase alpha subunit
MSDAAVRFATAIGYQGAGTAEFVLEGRDFFFLELNGRIQVEHPVTEEVTGVDLVQWQLRIAGGEKLDVRPQFSGAAVEARLYAEDPQSFLPQTGRIERLRLPSSIRVESAVAEGDEVGIAYDPMIAKLIARGATRDEAFDRLTAALAQTEVVGITTNLPFLRWLVSHPAVRAGETTTAFLTEYPPLSAPPRALPAAVWRGAFRLNLPSAPLVAAPDVDSLAVDHTPGAGGPHAVVAPMPGTVISVKVHEGSTVKAGEPLVVLEAMKMETPLASPYDAVVRAVHVQEGDRVAGGALLVELDG